MEAGSLHDLCEYCLLSQLSESGACGGEASLMTSKNKRQEYSKTKGVEWSKQKGLEWGYKP